MLIFTFYIFFFLIFNLKINKKIIYKTFIILIVPVAGSYLISFIWLVKKVRKFKIPEKTIGGNSNLLENNEIEKNDDDDVSIGEIEENQESKINNNLTFKNFRNLFPKIAFFCLNLSLVRIFKYKRF